jgi:N-carbamoyl-L-amino-acid hydrolase
MDDLIKTFSQYGATGNGGITRYELSEASIQARDEFKKRMEAIGAVVEVDDLANMYATLPGSDPDDNRCQ